MIKKIWHLLLGINMKKQYLFWYRYEDSELQNFGDLVGIELFKKLSGITAKHINDRPSFISTKHIPHYLMVGSILREARKSSIVWGSGIINTEFGVDRRAKYLAVRGPRSRKQIIAQGGVCPEVYGDPALLLSLLYATQSKKATQMTVIPHYVDYDRILTEVSGRQEIDIIRMMTADFAKTLSDINSSNFIISSSLHGLILAVAYGIPCLWVEFSDKIFGDDTKYYDFFESLGIFNAQKYIVTDLNDFILNIDSYKPIVVTPDIVYNLQKGLIYSYPFEINDLVAKNKVL